MRGDAVEPSDGQQFLSESDALKGIPVYSMGGRRLGVLDRVIIHRATGGISFLVLIRRRLFGLLRQRIVLPQAALRSSGTSGGFTVQWPLGKMADDGADRPATATLAVVRLDPSRGEDPAAE